MDEEQKALLMIAIMAAQSDQEQSEAERQAIVSTVAGAGLTAQYVEGFARKLLGRWRGATT